MLFVLIMVLILLPSKPEEETSKDIDLETNFTVEIYWPEEVDVDVDLWIKTPGDSPIGYSRKNGIYFDLLRDDLGRINDIGPLNYEIAVARNAPSGEYIFNLHLYRNRDSTKLMVVPVTMIIRASNKKLSNPYVVFQNHVKLKYEGEEITVARFFFDAETGQRGKIINIPKKIRGQTGYD